MKVLIANVHNDNFGGGELYTLQVAHAISGFAEVLFVQEPNPTLRASNPELTFPYRIWDAWEKVDHFLNISFFDPLICNTASRNVQVTFFPNPKHKVGEFDAFVAICPYAAKYVKEYCGEDAAVCQPYSRHIEPGEKKPDTIVSVGNFFREADGHSKNQHLMVEGLRKLGEGWSLTLIGTVGNPKYLDEIQAAASGLDVRILTNCSEEQKVKILRESEFYWHAIGFGRENPAQTEHFGIAPEEALKAGCLTYVHNSGGAKDFCRAWEEVDELVEMTRQYEPNKPGVKFQTPEGMRAFWKEFLHG